MELSFGEWYSNPSRGPLKPRTACARSNRPLTVPEYEARVPIDDDERSQRTQAPR